MLALLALAALAATTNCSDADAANYISTWTYDGGARPQPTMITRTQQGWLNGKSVGENTFTEQGGWIDAFDLQFSGQQVYLGEQENPSENVKTRYYAITMTLSQGKASFNGTVLCAKQSWIIPPPVPRN